MSFGVYGAIKALREIDERKAALQKFDSLPLEDQIKMARDLVVNKATTNDPVLNLAWMCVGTALGITLVAVFGPICA